MIIGITGGTGCGKTTALDAIRELGGTVVDCDAVYHQLLKTDKGLLAAIEQRFPGTVTENILDRKKLGSIVFSDKQALLDLNTITHNAVRQEVLRILDSGFTLAAVDAIELFDGGLSQLCHTTVAITAPEEDRITRLLQRDNITREQALLRIRAQKSESYFRSMCDHVLENTGTQAQFHEKCLAFFRRITIMEENTTNKEIKL